MINGHQIQRHIHLSATYSHDKQLTMHNVYFGGDFEVLTGDTLTSLIILTHLNTTHIWNVLKPLDNIGKTEKQKCSQIYT